MRVWKNPHPWLAFAEAIGRHCRLPMPELPEVEVTRRKLEPRVVGRAIARVETTRPSYFFLTAPRTLARKLQGRTVVGLHRVGKYLLLDLDDGRRVLMHLGMTGQLFTEGATSIRLLKARERALLTPDGQRRFASDEHTHLRIEFDDDGPALLFRDTRKFGKVKLLDVGEAEPRLARLGPDALATTGETLYLATRKRRAPIKTVLLDQSVVAGVGNIYADEALFLAAIRPGRAANRLSRSACDRIAQAIRRVLKRSIETGGSSISDYIAPDGQDGAYQDERHVYARATLPCHTCGTPIRRVVMSQRSAHFCPRCQRA